MSDRRALLLRPIATAREILGNNRRAAYVAAVALAILYYTGNLPAPGAIPTWWPVVAIAGVATYVGGRWAARRILELVPEPEGILLVEFDASDPGGGAIYELSEEAFESMWVFGGDLFQWDESPRRVYEVREYDPEKNLAVANWREAPPGSALASQSTVDDALAAIRELREDLEPDVAEARELRRRIRGIVRELDKERAQAQQAVLDDHIAPDVGGSRSIDDVIEDALPDELHPAQGASEHDRERPPDAPTGPKENGDSPDDDEDADDEPKGLLAELAAGETNG